LYRDQQSWKIKLSLSVILLLRKYSTAELLRLSGIEQEASTHEDKTTSDDDKTQLHTIDLNSLEYLNSRIIGAVC